MTNRESERDRLGEQFCEIEFDGFYHPIWSGELVRLAKEVWSIMDDEQRSEFLREVTDTLSTWRAIKQEIPPGSPVQWQG